MSVVPVGVPVVGMAVAVVPVGGSLMSVRASLPWRVTVSVSAHRHRLEPRHGLSEDLLAYSVSSDTRDARVYRYLLVEPRGLHHGLAACHLVLRHLHNLLRGVVSHGVMVFEWTPTSSVSSRPYMRAYASCRILAIWSSWARWAGSCIIALSCACMPAISCICCSGVTGCPGCTVLHRYGRDAARHNLNADRLHCFLHHALLCGAHGVQHLKLLLLQRVHVRSSICSSGCRGRLRCQCCLLGLHKCGLLSTLPSVGISSDAMCHAP